MKTAFYAIMILVTISSCQRKGKCNCNSLAWVEKYNDSLLNRKHYPEHHVKRFGEEDLRIMGNHTIRFVISGAFGDSKLYRIEQKENYYSLLTKTFVCGEFSDYKDSPVESESRILSEDEVQPILKMLDDSCFWTAPTISPTREFILDGCSKFLEVYDPEGNSCTQKKYHIVGRLLYYPPGFWSICDKIMKLDPLKENFQ